MTKRKRPLKRPKKRTSARKKISAKPKEPQSTLLLAASEMVDRVRGAISSKKRAIAPVVEISHPILEHKLTMLRDRNTTHSGFRAVVGEVSRLLAYEATRDLALREHPIETPLEPTIGKSIGEDLIVVSVMRAGLGMLDSVLGMLPFARAGHIGMYRDSFIHATVEYYFKIPEDAKGKRIMLVDPMLATAGTAVAAIDRLKQYEVGAIRFVCIVASPEGIRELQENHPDVSIYCLKIDRQLNEKNYILPGLGDAGDRLYGTKIVSPIGVSKKT